MHVLQHCTLHGTPTCTQFSSTFLSVSHFVVSLFVYNEEIQVLQQATAILSGANFDDALTFSQGHKKSCRQEQAGRRCSGHDSDDH